MDIRISTDKSELDVEFIHSFLSVSLRWSNPFGQIFSKVKFVF